MADRVDILSVDERSNILDQVDQLELFMEQVRFSIGAVTRNSMDDLRLRAKLVNELDGYVLAKARLQRQLKADTDARAVFGYKTSGLREWLTI